MFLLECPQIKCCSSLVPTTNHWLITMLYCWHSYRLNVVHRFFPYHHTSKSMAMHDALLKPDSFELHGLINHELLNPKTNVFTIVCYHPQVDFDYIFHFLPTRVGKSPILDHYLFPFMNSGHSKTQMLQMVYQQNKQKHYKVTGLAYFYIMLGFGASCHLSLDCPKSNSKPWILGCHCPSGVNPGAYPRCQVLGLHAGYRWETCAAPVSDYLDFFFGGGYYKKGVIHCKCFYSFVCWLRFAPKDCDFQSVSEHFHIW